MLSPEVRKEYKNLGQWLANLFCMGPDGKYFRLCRSLVNSAITQHLVCVTKIAIGSKYVTVTLKFEFHMIVTFSGAVTPFFLP